MSRSSLRRRAIALVAVATLSVTALSATFTDSTNSEQQDLSTASGSIELADGDLRHTVTSSVEDLVPGDSVSRRVEVRNGASYDFASISVSAEDGAADKSFTTNSEGLRLTIERCDSSYANCSIIYGQHGAPVGDLMPDLSGPALEHGQSDYLVFTQTFVGPDDSNVLKGAETQIIYTFIATQRDGVSPVTAPPAPQNLTAAQPIQMSGVYARRMYPAIDRVSGATSYRVYAEGRATDGSVTSQTLIREFNDSQLAPGSHPTLMISNPSTSVWADGWNCLAISAINEGGEGPVTRPSSHNQSGLCYFLVGVPEAPQLLSTAVGQNVAVFTLSGSGFPEVSLDGVALTSVSNVGEISYYGITDPVYAFSSDNTHSSLYVANVPTGTHTFSIAMRNQRGTGPATETQVDMDQPAPALGSITAENIVYEANTGHTSYDLIVSLAPGDNTLAGYLYGPNLGMWPNATNVTFGPNGQVVKVSGEGWHSGGSGTTLHASLHTAAGVLTVDLPLP